MNRKDDIRFNFPSLEQHHATITARSRARRIAKLPWIAIGLLTASLLARAVFR